jgi:type II secretory ATPase GspE/PulE/Tfp pilus assembly ATPase PilB-like protein
MNNAYLEFVGGKQFPLDRSRITIGRQAGCDIVLDEKLASRTHCQIERVGSDYVLRDLESRNGTRVNGELISSHVLATNDVISIGATEMIFVNVVEQVDDVDMLSSDDLVEVDPAQAGSSEDNVVPFISQGLDNEQGLEQLAEALQDRTFGEAEIELINARGGTLHASSQKQRGKGAREPVEILRLILLICFRSRASDIHLEARQESYQARLRIDGEMVDIMKMSKEFGNKLATLVKVLSDIDIAHKNNIQEGHFSTVVPAPKLKSGKRRVDYRVSFAPALYGQKLVVRILDPANAPLRIADLNLPKWMYDKLADAIRGDSGMVMVSGPTGSGKTTSLYALIRSIDATRRNVITIEDPVEIQIENVTQIPVDEEHDRSFSQLLRSCLRQDPDVLLVGEIRDGETSRIAMQAAITGHLVFSTLHTKDSVGSIFRLLDLGVEPYLVAQALHVVLAQRLVRRLCPYCKKPVTATAEQKQLMGAAGANVSKIYVPKGCMRCLGTGYAGRQAFYEMLTVNDQLRDVILNNPSMQAISAALSDQKFVSLQQAAYQLVAEGVSPFDEVQSVVGRG